MPLVLLAARVVLVMMLTHLLVRVHCLRAVVVVVVVQLAERVAQALLARERQVPLLAPRLRLIRQVVVVVVVTIHRTQAALAVQVSHT